MVSKGILPTACCIFFLTACASNQLTIDPPIKVTPMTAKSSSDNPDAMYQTGRYYQGQGRYDLAMDAYQKALAADSNFVEAFNGVGVIYAKQNKYEEAVNAFQSAIRLNPKSAHTLNNLGYVYFLQGEYDASVRTLEQSVAIDPLNKHTLNNLGLVYAKTGHVIDAEQAFSKASNVSSSVINVDSHDKNTEVQELSLPKNMGVIKMTSLPLAIINPAPENAGRVKLVQFSSNVYDLRINPFGSKNASAKVSDTVKGSLRFELSNGNGVTGFAKKIGNFLTSQGYSQSRLTNQKPFNILVTQIQYKEGFQTEAQRVQSMFPESFELVKRDDLRPDVSVRVLLGKDILTRTAYFSK